MATQVGAAAADVYLMWGEPLAAIRDRIQAMKALVAAKGRTDKIRYGLRINIIARRTELEAVAAAAEMISKVSPDVLEQVRKADSPNPRGESVGQNRQREFRAGADTNWYVEPGLWAGIAVVRSGAGMAIVGSYQQVADRLLAYIDLGITVLILSGYPHLEECENIGRNVLPLVREGYLDRYSDRLR